MQMEKITIVNINKTDYKLTESAYLLLSDYNKFIKRTIPDKEKIADIEIQISVIIDMEIEERGKISVVNVDIIKEVISVLKENQKIFYYPHNIKRKRKTERRKTQSGSNIKRDKRNNVFGGVCAGIANRFNIDPMLIRIMFIVATLITGVFLILYIILWAVLPEDK